MGAPEEGRGGLVEAGAALAVLSSPSQGEQQSPACGCPDHASSSSSPHTSDTGWRGSRAAWALGEGSVPKILMGYLLNYPFAALLCQPAWRLRGAAWGQAGACGPVGAAGVVGQWAKPVGVSTSLWGLSVGRVGMLLVLPPPALL